MHFQKVFPEHVVVVNNGVRGEGRGDCGEDEGGRGELADVMVADVGDVAEVVAGRGGQGKGGRGDDWRGR